MNAATPAGEHRGRDVGGRRTEPLRSGPSAAARRAARQDQVFVEVGLWTFAGLILAAWLTGCGKPSLSPAPVAPPQVDVSRLDPLQANLIQEAYSNVVAATQSAEAWGRLGQTLHAVEYNQAARDAYAQAMSLAPQAPEWRYLLGLLQLQDHEDAGLDHLRQVVAQVDINPDAPRLLLARTLVERGRYDEARPHLQRLLEVHPLHAGARLEWGRINLAEGSLDIAAESLKVCLTNQFTTRPGLLLLAQVRQRQGQADEAAELARRADAMPREFGWPDPWLLAVQRLRIDRQKLQDRVNDLLMQRQFAEAVTHLNRLLRAYPEDPDTYLLLGRMQYQQRQCAEAEAAIRRHLQMKPDSLNGLIQLSLTLFCQQQWTNAATVLEQALVLKPDFATAHYNLGIARIRSGDTAAAMLSFTNALRCHPGYVDAHTALAEELRRLGDGAGAAEHVRRALELDPQNAKARRLQ